MFHRHLEVFRYNESDEIIIRQYDEKGYLNCIRVPLSQAEEFHLEVKYILDELDGGLGKDGDHE